MAQSSWAAIAWLLCTLALAFNSALTLCAAPTVWSGPTINFTKTGADPGDTTDPLNQDRLTNNVWLTRAGEQGMFNVAPGHEDSYVRYTSPDDTSWATSVMPANSGKTIAASNWAQLTFTDWAPAYGGPGSALGGNITTHNAVVHLLTDDIYLDLTFTFYRSGGEYSYFRSTAAVPEPSTAALVIVASALFACVRRRKCRGSICSQMAPIFTVASPPGINDPAITAEPSYDFKKA